MWRYAELLPIDGPPAVGMRQRDDAAGPRRSAGQAPRPVARSGSRTTRSAHPTLSFKDRVVSVAISKAIEFGLKTVACASTGNLANATAAQAAAGRPAGRHPDPVRSRAGEDPRHQHLRRARRRRQRDLRRRQPAVLRDRRQIRLGVRQRQPAAVLRRGLEELRLRDRRAARLAAARAHRRADGGRLAGHQDRQGVRRAGEAGAARGAGAAQAAHPRRPGGRLRADRRHGAREPRSDPAGARRRPASRSRWRSATRPTGSTRARRSSARAAGPASRTTRRSSPAMRLLAETEGIFTETAGGVTLGAAHPADRERADRQGRRAGRHLHHRQRHEDAGPAGRQAARARADRPAAVRFRRALQATWT